MLIHSTSLQCGGFKYSIKIILSRYLFIAPVTPLHLRLTVNCQCILIVKASSQNLTFTTLARTSLQVKPSALKGMFFYKLNTIWIIYLSVFPSVL